MSGFVPLRRSQLAFVGTEYFIGGEDGDSNDLRDETAVDQWDRVVLTPWDILIAAVEERDVTSSPSEFGGHAEVGGKVPITVNVNGVPLGVALAYGFEGEDAPDTLDLAQRGAFDDVVPIDFDATIITAIPTTEAERALTALERDGIRQIGSRLAAHLAYGRYAFHRDYNWGRAPNAWKRHRPTQYRSDLEPRPLS